MGTEKGPKFVVSQQVKDIKKQWAVQYHLPFKKPFIMK